MWPPPEHKEEKKVPRVGKLQIDEQVISNIENRIVGKKSRKPVHGVQDEALQPIMKKGTEVRQYHMFLVYIYIW